MRTVVDTWVWIEILSEGPLNKKAAEMLKGMQLVTTTANIYELTVYLRRYQPAKHQLIIRSIIAQCQDVIPITKVIAEKAGEIKSAAKKDIGAVDCFVLGAAAVYSAKVISGDPHFKGYPNAELIEP